MSKVKFWNATLCNGSDFDEVNANDEALQSHLGNLSQSFHLTALIGSGASMGIGKDYAGPSMTDLVDVVKAIHTYPQVLKWTGHTKDPGDIECFLSECECLQGLPQKSESDFERGAAEESLTGGDTQEAKTPLVSDAVFTLTASQKDVLKNFLFEAKRIIRKRCDFLNDAPPTGMLPFSLESHEKFLRCFGRRSGRKSRLKIFTTNYDLCFEKAAGKTNFVLIDGFSFTFPRQFSSLNYGLEIAQKSESSLDSLEPIESLAHLFKLHGSVNWAIKDGSVVMTNSPEVPCIIHPSSAKYQQAFQQPYLEMISHYLEAMRKLDQTLIVVGFGFADAHLVAPIDAALASSSKFRLVVVDPDIENRLATGRGFYDVLNKWREQKDPRITLVRGDFQSSWDLFRNCIKNPKRNNWLMLSGRSQCLPRLTSNGCIAAFGAAASDRSRLFRDCGDCEGQSQSSIFTGGDSAQGWTLWIG